MDRVAIPAPEPRRVLWVRWIFALGLVLGACTPPEGIPIVVDLAIDEDGEVLRLEARGPRGDEGPLTSVGQVDELCLEGGACFRLEEAMRVTESSDRWATSEVVWSIDPDAAWLPHNFSFHLDGAEPEVGVFDIVETRDGTVAVAAGHLGVLHRSAEGVWSPSVTELRSSVFHYGYLLFPAVTALLSFGFAHGLREPGYRPGLVAAALLSLSSIVTGIARYNGTEGWQTLALLTSPIGIVGFVLFIGLLLDVVRSVRWQPRIYLISAAAAIALIASAAIPSRLWSANVFSAWLPVNIIPVIVFAGLLVGLPKLLRFVHSPIPTSKGQLESAVEL